MMKNCLFIFLGLVATSCTYNSEEELGILIPGGIPIEEHEISFQTTVRPIINANCAISGCHVAGEFIPDWSIDQNVVDRSDDIRTEVLSGRMPRGGSLTFEEKDLLISWINQGAQLD